MECRICATDVPDAAASCPDCGAHVDHAYGSSDRLRTDGGTGDDPGEGGGPSDGESSDGEPPAGEPPAGEPSDREPPADETPAGEPPADETPATEDAVPSSPSDEVPSHASDHGQPGTRDPGPAAGGGAGAHPSERSPGAETASDRVMDALDRLPLAAGGFIGAVALLIPYVVITVVTFVAADRGDPISVAADMFFTIVTLGPGQLFVDGFVSVSSITALRNVDPSDYPSVEAELDAAIDLLQASPDAALLLLYVAAPWILYLGGRYLSRHYALEATALGHALAGATVVVGTFPVVLVLGLAFSPPAVFQSLVVFGLCVPAVLGAIGGLSVYAFRRESAATSKVVGWLAVVLGVLVCFVLSPWLSFSLDLAQRFSVSAMVFLDVVSLSVGGTLLAVLILVLVVLSAGLAGFVRAYLARDAIESPIDGARLGASVALGYVGGVTLLAVVVPLSTIVIGTPGVGNALAAAQPTVAEFLRTVLLGGIVFPLIFGTVGGFLAARQVTQEPARR